MLVEEIDQVKNEIVNRFLHPNKMAKIFEKRLGKKYNTIFSAYKTPKLDPDDMTVNAYFDHYASKKIEIVLVYSSEVKKGLEIHEDSWENLAFRIYQAYQHELIHKKQWKKKKNKNKKERERNYFTDPDEIDAHAHDIALEFLFNGFTVEEAVNNLKNYKKVCLTESITLFSYLVYFEYKDHPALRKLVKRTVYYLEKRGT